MNVDPHTLQRKKFAESGVENIYIISGVDLRKASFEQTPKLTSISSERNKLVATIHTCMISHLKIIEN
jgi:hypothetical protein